MALCELASLFRRALSALRPATSSSFVCNCVFAAMSWIWSYRRRRSTRGSMALWRRCPAWLAVGHVAADVALRVAVVDDGRQCGLRMAVPTLSRLGRVDDVVDAGSHDARQCCDRRTGWSCGVAQRTGGNVCAACRSRRGASTHSEAPWTVWAAETTVAEPSPHLGALLRLTKVLR